jgi:hypothetical protein
MNRPNFIASIDVQTLCRAMAESQVGDILTYQQLSALIHKDIQTEGRQALLSARRIVQRDMQIVFGTIYKEGLKRLSDTEIVMTGQQTVVRIRRASHRGAARVAVARPERLQPDGRLRQNTLLSLLAMIHASTTESRMRKLEGKVAQAESKLPLEATLNAMQQLLHDPQPHNKE